MISPCINIAIGKDGTICVQNLASIFHTREDLFPQLMSFYSIDIENEIQFDVFDKTTHQFINYRLPNKEDDKLTNNHIFIANAYNDLISIINVLFKDLQYTYINVNLVYSALEVDLSIIETISNIIKQYTLDGTFGTVIVKNYVILSDGTGILSTKQEELITSNLSFLENVRETNPIVDSIFLLDDKNINAVFLGYKHEYLSFALYEFLIAIMTNQYKLISNLPGKNKLMSFGIGSVFFDKFYFNAFFDNRIFNAFLEKESIATNKRNYYNISVFDSINGIFNNFYSDCTTDISMLLKIVTADSKESENLNIGSYLHMLQLLLGKTQDQVINEEKFTLQYNIKELIFNIVHEYILENKKEYISVNEAKRKYVEHMYNEKELYELKTLEEDYSEEINTLEKTIKDSNTILAAYNKQLEKSFLKYKKPLERKYLQLNQLTDLNKRLEELNKKKQITKELHKQKNFFSRLFTNRAFKREIIEINHDITALKQEINSKSKNIEQIQNALNELYKLYEICNDLNNKISLIVDDLHQHQSFLYQEWKGTPYIDYSFVQNILDIELLEDYFIKHKSQLTRDTTIPIIELINEKSDIIDIVGDYITKTLNNRYEIINFYISDYMLGEYDHLKLFTPFDFNTDIQKLKERSRPFVNVIPTYIVQTHELFSICNCKKKDQVLQQMTKYYSSSIPQTMENPNKDRFIAINIESIVSTKKIAKSTKKDKE